MTKTFRVVRTHQASTANPLIVRQGDEVTISDKTTEYAGWIWCTTTTGKSGWVPENFVERDGEQGTMRRDYDATELTVEAGREFTVLETESGWAWCTDQQGTTGWLPLEHLEMV